MTDQPHETRPPSRNLLRETAVTPPETRTNAHPATPTPPQQPPTRLYGRPEHEHLHSTLTGAWIAHTNSYGFPAADEPLSFIEYSVHSVRDHLPTVERIAEEIDDWVAESGEVDEIMGDEIHDAVHSEEVKHAIHDLLDTIAAEVGNYRMAKSRIREWEVFLREDGKVNARPSSGLTPDCVSVGDLLDHSDGVAVAVVRGFTAEGLMVFDAPATLRAGMWFRRLGFLQPGSVSLISSNPLRMSNPPVSET